eukprot:1142695-Pelagomonas_calceolata.AAC.5
MAPSKGAGLQWLFPFVDGHPPIGWETAGAYLIMPVLLGRRIVSSKQPAPQRYFSLQQCLNAATAQQSQCASAFSVMPAGHLPICEPKNHFASRLKRPRPTAIPGHPQVFAVDDW